MLRTTRPFLNSARRIVLAGRAPHARPTQAQLLLCAPLTSRPRFPHRNIAASQAAPLIVWTAFSTKPPKPPLQPNKRDAQAEKEIAKRKIEARPEEISAESSVRHVLEYGQEQSNKGDKEMLKDLKSDLNTIKDTFALSTVPRESYALGLAGTLPYLATSVATVYLSWDLNTTWPTSSHFLNHIIISHDTASQWLHLLEPIQVGYGAVIISFLGAIHWGLEIGEKSAAGERTRFRYGIGVLAPAVAWPTIFMPVEWALTTQFLAFTLLYLADSRATTRGWAPQWYGTYRWVLTAVVGVAVVISLVGRAKVGETRRLTTDELRDRLHKRPAGSEPYHNWAKEEEEEKVRIKEKEEAERKEKKKGGEQQNGGKGKSKEDDEKKQDDGNDKTNNEEEGKKK